MALLQKKLEKERKLDLLREGVDYTLKRLLIKRKYLLNEIT